MSPRYLVVDPQRDVVYTHDEYGRERLRIDIPGIPSEDVHLRMPDGVIVTLAEVEEMYWDAVNSD